MERENNLTRLRERRGMTQREVAEELDVSRQAVSQWERGAAFPSMEKQLALSRLYGVTLEELYRENANWDIKPEPVLESPISEAQDRSESADAQEPDVEPQHRKKSCALVGGILVFLGCFLFYAFGVFRNSVAITINILIFLFLLIMSAILCRAIIVIIYHWKKGNKKK